MSKIFIVEDNLKYRKAASECFKEKHDVDFAVDYDSAMNLLSNKYSYAMVDLFFPKNTGTNDISLGRDLVLKMIDCDSVEKNARELINELNKYVDINDAELAPIIKVFAYENKDGIKNPVFSAIKRVGKTLGKEIATKISTNSLKLLYTPSHLDHSNRNKRPDYYGELEKAIEKSEANQPLGILIGEKLKDMEIPFVFVTSTYHHDVITQPVCDYISRKNLGSVIDCSPGKEDEKAISEFWERAFNILTKK